MNKSPNVNVFIKKNTMKSIFIKSILLLMMSITILPSCREGTVAEDIDIELGTDYYPLEVGKFLEYQVDSTIYDFDGNLAIILESTTFIREEIVGTTIDNEGDTTFIIERFEKSDFLAPWEIKDVWSTKIANNRAEKIEENIRLIKMVYPLREGVDFNAALFVEEGLTVSIAGETLEAFKNWNSEVQTIDTPETIGSFSFNNVATMLYADDENLIEKRYAIAKYAKGIGLAYKEEWILDTQELTETLPWEEKAEIGYILRQTLINHN